MQIRLATLNLWALPEPLGRDVQERIDAVGRRLPALDLDVIAFQEVWTRDAADRLRAAGRRAGLEHSWFGDGPFGDGGLLLLSRLPVDEVRFEAYAVTGAPEKAAANLEYLSGKGFATARLRTPAGPLVLVNTHLHARYTGSAPHRHMPHRTGQAVQLTARFVDRPEPLVAVGDFNFREGETDYRVLTDILGVRDVAASLGRRESTTLRLNPYRSERSLDRRKDYVFVRDGADTAVVPTTISRSFDEIFEIHGQAGSYSNHAGLITELSLVPQGALTGRQAVSADPGVFADAARALAKGERLALARQDGARKLYGIGAGVAAAAALTALPERISRRRLLRATLSGAALAALAPSVGFTIASELLVPNEIRAFRVAARQLAELDPRHDPSVRDPAPNVAAGPPA